MSDNKFYFPKLLDDNDYDKLQIDFIGKYSITIPKIADIITDIIYKLFNNNDIVITDCTAGVGGNIFSFANKFKYVNAIELDKSRFNMLENNINVYNLKNVSCFNINCLDIIFTLQQDVIFIDPPWGGKEYKSEYNIKLYLGNISIEQVTNMLLNNKVCKYVVLKLPLNYDINNIKNIINEEKKIIIHKLNKMLIIIIF
jgi:16S rRNA G966 N2-methylase RsmD